MTWICLFVWSIHPFLLIEVFIPSSMYFHPHLLYFPDVSIVPFTPSWRQRPHPPPLPAQLVVICGAQLVKNFHPRVYISQRDKVMRRQSKTSKYCRGHAPALINMQISLSPPSLSWLCCLTFRGVLGYRYLSAGTFPSLWQIAAITLMKLKDDTIMMM